MSNTSDSTAILNRIGLRLPPSAMIEHTGYSAGMDDSANVLVVMSEADWATFLKDITRQAPRPPEFLEDNNVMLGTAVPGWNPAEARGLKTGQLAGKNETEALNVGYAAAGPGKVRVFLFWHQI